jgi:5-bromo-4-chloroindolyl phosphate hydrolysis protein
MKYLTMILLYLATSPHAIADALSTLQRQTSHAYQQMKESEREASKADQEVKAKEERWQYFKQKFTEAEQELENSRKASVQANKKLTEAKKNWNDYSETLYQEWHQERGNK